MATWKIDARDVRSFRPAGKLRTSGGIQIGEGVVGLD
jgi:hypothetical protein